MIYGGIRCSLKRYKYNTLNILTVLYGRRSSFRDWSGEVSSFPREVAEMALAHVVENKVEAAYRRGDLFAKRCSMMQAWDNYLKK